MAPRRRADCRGVASFSVINVNIPWRNLPVGGFHVCTTVCSVGKHYFQHLELINGDATSADAFAAWLTVREYSLSLTYKD